MKYYLSSFRIGDHGDRLVELVDGGSLAYLPNALDHISPSEQEASRGRNLAELEKLGIRAEVVDLRKFFSRPSELRHELEAFSGVWVSGGNTFVLRQAMRLSGFDSILADLTPTSFLYSGYSAGICVLAPDLRALQIVDDPKQLPYREQSETMWEGLNLLDYLILPHYKSNHPESEDIDKEVEFCRANQISFRTLRDGEALFGSDMRTIRKALAVNR